MSCVQVRLSGDLYTGKLVKSREKMSLQKGRHASRHLLSSRTSQDELCVLLLEQWSPEMR